MAFAAGQKLTATLLNAEFNRTRTVSTPGDSTPVVSSTTLVSATSLVLSVEAGATYKFEAETIFDTNATADFKGLFALPAGSFIRLSEWASGAGAAATDATIFHDAIDSGAFVCGGIAAGTFMTARPAGIIIVGGTAGNCQFQFAQNVSNATGTILKGGSWMTLTKVG